MTTSDRENAHVRCVACGAQFALDVPQLIDSSATPARLSAILDGSLFRTSCPRCEVAMDLDFAVLVYLADRALPLVFIPAEGTTNEEDSNEFARLIGVFSSSHPPDAGIPWNELVWISRRTEFHNVLRRQSVPSTSRRSLPSILRIHKVQTMEEIRLAIEGHPELLERETQELLEEIIDQRWLIRAEEDAADYEDDLSLLQSFREIGIERTLEDLDRDPGPELLALHSAADAATEAYLESRTPLNLQGRERAYEEILNHPMFSASPNGFRWRIHLAVAYMDHDWYEDEGDSARLDQAIQHIERALDVVPLLSRRERCVLLNSAATWRMKRFEHTNLKDDLDSAVSAWEEGYVIAPKANPKSLMIVGNLGRSLRDRFNYGGDVTDLDRAVELLEEGIPTAQAFNKAEMIGPLLNSLGTVHFLRYETSGAGADLERAIEMLTAAATQEGDVRARRYAASNLARALSTRYRRSGSLGDIDAAIDLLRRLIASPESEEDAASLSDSLGRACLARYGRTRDSNDLYAALSSYEQGVITWRNAGALASFADALVSRYDLHGDLEDLQRALALLDEALVSGSASEEQRTAIHARYANACERAFERTESRDWIDRGVDHYAEAHEATAPDTPWFPSSLFLLGRALATRFRRFHEAPDCVRADRLLDYACRTGLTRDPAKTFAAGRYWGDWTAERGDWEKAARAFNYAAAAASQLLRAQPDRAAQEILLKAFQGLSSARAHGLARIGRSADAVSALEGGRGRLRDRRARLSDLALKRLVAMGQGNLARRYRDLTAEIAALETSASETLHADLDALVAESHRHLGTAATETVEFADVAALTTTPRAPQIIYLATHEELTLALIVNHGRVRVLRLPLTAAVLGELLLTLKPREQLSLEETQILHVERIAFTTYSSTQALADQYTPAVPDAFRDADLPWSRERYLEAGAVTGGWLAAQRGHISYERALDTTLPALWSQLMEPLGADLLRDRDGTNPLRVALIPCGELALLPLHGAWEQFADLEQRGDLVFTYAPAAQLLERMDPVESVEGSERFLGVSNTQDETAPLNFAELEASICSVIAAARPTDVLSRNAATYEEVTSRLQDATLLHFACHGTFDEASPMASAVYLAGGVPLTLAEVIRLRLPRAPLVILSACETAISDTRFLPDEALGLANGFLEAGARGVVSTLWPVNDVSTMLLVELFYLSWIREKLPAPRALRDAREGLRNMRAVDVSHRLGLLRDGLPPGQSLSISVIKQLRRFAAMPVEQRPFEHPYYWAGFTYSGA